MRSTQIFAIVAMSWSGEIDVEVNTDIVNGERIFDFTEVVTNHNCMPACMGHTGIHFVLQSTLLCMALWYVLFMVSIVATLHEYDIYIIVVVKRTTLAKFHASMLKIDTVEYIEHVKWIVLKCTL